MGFGTPAARAAFPGTNGRILVQPGTGGAFTMASDGSDHTPVDGYTGAGAGSLSADGLREAYAPGGSGLKVRTLATGNEVTIVASGTNVASPVFSPDGKQVAWQAGTAQVLRAPADGSGGSQPVVSAGAGEGFGRGIAWTPDGSEIVIAGFDNGGPGCFCSSSKVIAVNVTTGARRSVVAPDAFVQDNEAGALAADVAGDGSKVVFLEAVSPPTGSSFVTIAVAPLAGGSATAIRTVGHGQAALPRFSPDGATVIYSAARAGGTSEVRAIGASGVGDHLVDDAAGAGYNAIDSLQWLSAGCVDSDGDALCDDWERHGLDVNGDGTVDVDLPAMGARPDHKDIFVEIDAMSGHEIEPLAIDSVVQAFAAAPVLNPDGTTGITLHVDNGPASVMDPVTGATWGARSEHETLPHQDVLGGMVNKAYDWTAFDAVKAAHFDDARRPVFHYVVAAHLQDANDTSSGVSRGIGASDIVISLGGCQAPGGPDCNLGAREQAGTLMHELGHNLGLRHGGTDDINYKPTYLSIMNYAFQFSWLRHADGTRVLDYSRFPLSLDERGLDELSGWGVPAGAEAAKFFTVAVDCSGGLALYTLDASAFDFNCDRAFASPVTADLNGDGDLTSLAGPVDWPRLVFNGGEVGSLGAVVLPATTPLVEPPLSELLADESLADGTSRGQPPVVAPVITPGSSATTPPAGGRARCTLGAPSRKRLRLALRVRCDRTATVRIRARLTIGRAHVNAKPVTRHVRANRRATLTLTLPRRAARAIAHHRHVSATLTLRAANPAGTSVTTKRVRRLA